MSDVRLLVVNHRDPWHPSAGGAEEVLWEVGRRLAGMGFEVTWISERYPRSAAEEERSGIRFLRKGGTASLHLFSLAEARKYDVVLDSVAHAVPFLSFLSNPRAAALVHHVHQDVLRLELSPAAAALVGAAERALALYGNLITVSEYTRGEIARRFGVDPGRVRVIRNGVDHARFRPGEKFRRPLFLWIGRMRRYKNPMDAVAIFHIARRMVGDERAEFAIAGGGELSGAVRAAAEARGIRFLGRVGEGEKEELYRRAWAVLVTSYVEGWGMVAVEANASGTPVVAYATGALPELVRNGRNGILVPYRDLRAAARAIVELADEGRMLRMSRAALEESMKYDWDRTAAEYAEYLGRLAVEGRPRARARPLP
ncbi:MAG: glycosyltransferase family 4 protein [Conexivisphaerales archaeon]|nr:glycosyltransferase family 4 protein [Conexivisphaerales archaeon]